MAFKQALLLTVLSSAVLVATAQDAMAPSPSMNMMNSLPPGFGQIQAQLRAEVNPNSFVTSFNSQQPGVNTAYGTVRFVLGQNNPALSTLPNAGLSQGLITLEPCALWAPHSHPRANEILFVSQGNLSIAFHEENPTNTSTGMVGGRFLNFTVPMGSSIVIPQGLIHYAFNPTCMPASIVTSFDNKDPGAISIAQQFFELPSAVVSAATGLSSTSIDLVKNQVAQTSVISMDQTCLQSCPGAPAASRSG